MKKLSDYFYDKSNLIVAIILTVICFSYAFTVLVDASKCFEVQGSEVTSLGVKLGFGHADVVSFFSARTPEMIECYKDLLIVWDNIFAVLYGLMYLTWLSLLLKPFRNKVRFLNLLPIVQVIFDWLENFQLTGIANSFLAGETISSTPSLFASSFSMFKWIASGIMFVVILVGVVLRIINAIKSKKS